MSLRVTPLRDVETTLLHRHTPGVAPWKKVAAYCLLVAFTALALLTNGLVCLYAPSYLPISMAATSIVMLPIPSLVRPVLVV
jgi:hypothetical protein